MIFNKITKYLNLLYNSLSDSIFYKSNIQLSLKLGNIRRISTVLLLFDVGKELIQFHFLLHLCKRDY